ncbi:unnamed protein product [Mucor hiemalis]
MSRTNSSLLLSQVISASSKGKYLKRNFINFNNFTFFICIISYLLFLFLFFNSILIYCSLSIGNILRPFSISSFPSQNNFTKSGHHATEDVTMMLAAPNKFN